MKYTNDKIKKELNKLEEDNSYLHNKIIKFEEENQRMKKSQQDLNLKTLEASTIKATMTVDINNLNKEINDLKKKKWNSRR